MMETNSRETLRIALTMGDAAGIGAEITVKALSMPRIRERFRFLILGEKHTLETARRRWAPDLPLSIIHDGNAWDGTDPVPALVNLEGGLQERIPPGKASAETGRLAARCIEEAIRVALKGVVDAIVTCPINKEALALAGLPYPGHTEYLAYLTGARKVVMMLTGPSLKVTLVTIHCPLSAVSGLLTQERVLETITISHAGLSQDFGLSHPRLAVAAFNPHAGEGGLFGQEEAAVIAPAVRAACQAGMDATGPLPPDTVFLRAIKGEFDAVVCMYHDQALIPLKLLHFRDAVNVTLGLPVVRASVDHGTAYDIAGKGVADPTSLINAIETAGIMARSRAARKKNVPG
jgi:4-hydroxythreonine-4-phosphate dehydrogenase